MNLDITKLLPFKGSLVGFSRESMQVLGHLLMITTFGSGQSTKNVIVKYLIINVASPYNIIICRPSFNALEAALSNMYLTLKNPIDESVKDDQVKVNLVDIDPMEDPVEDSRMPIEDVKIVQIGAQPSQTTQIGSNLSLEKEDEIIGILRQNVDLLAWKPSDMPDIDPGVVCHHLGLDSVVKPIAQRKRNEGEGKRRIIEDEVRKLLKVGCIKEIRYPTWLANIFMVKEKSGKW